MTIKLGPDGLKKDTSLFYAIELEGIADEPVEKAASSLKSLLLHIYRTDGPTACREALLTLALNRPKLLLVSSIKEITGPWGTIQDVISENIDVLLDKHKHDTASMEPLIVFATQMRKVSLLRTLFSFKARSASDQVTRKNSVNDYLALTPREIDAQNSPKDGISSGKRLIIADQSVDPAFVTEHVSATDTATIHVYADLNGTTNYPQLDPEKYRTLGCRCVISRYSDAYKILHDKCHSFTNQVANIVLSDETLDEKIPLVGSENALKLLLADKIFYGAFSNSSVLTLVKSDQYDEITFLLGENTNLWAIVSSLTHIETGHTKILFATPSFSQKKRQHYVEKLDALRQALGLKKETHHFDLIDYTDNREHALETNRRMRFFAHCVAFRSKERAAAFSLEPADRPRILCVGGKFPAYFEGLATVHNGLLEDDKFESIYCHTGIDPEYSREHLFQNARTGGKWSKISGSRNFIDLYSAQSIDLMNLDLGDWIFKKHNYEFTNFMSEFDLSNTEDSAIYMAAFERLANIFRHEVGLFLSNLVFFGNFLENSGADLVVVCPSRSVNAMAFCGVAGTQGIKTYALDVHILDAKYPRNTSIYTDRVGVISNYFAAEYASRFGVTSKQIDVIGSLRLSKMVDDLKVHSKKSTRADIGFSDTNSTTVLLATQPIDWPIMEDCMRSIAQGFAQLENTHILLKLHREESSSRLNRYTSILREFNLNFSVMDVTAQIHHLVIASDCVATFFSTTAMEAHALGRPVITIQSKAGDWPTDWADMGIATAATEPSEIAAAISRLCKATPDGEGTAASGSNSTEILAHLSECFMTLINNEFQTDTNSQNELFVDHFKQETVIG